MSIRPVGFFSKNSKTIYIKFNKKIKSVDVSLFKVRALDDSGDALNVIDYKIEGFFVSIVTELQKPGKYYGLVIDNNRLSVVSEDNDIISNDKISRTIFFVGYDSYNPVRDSLLSGLPKIFLSENSLVKDIISEQANVMYDARKSVGSLLSDNFIRESVSEEFRVRGSSPSDRLSNENAFKVSRVSRNQSGSGEKLRKIFLNLDKERESIEIQNTISLQQEELEDTVSVSDFNDNKVTLSNNIISLVSIVSSSGKVYDFQNDKYTLTDNKYDSIFALRNEQLKPNQLSIGKTFADLLTFDESVSITYLSKNSEISPTSDISFYQVRDEFREVLPEQSYAFLLKNREVCDSYGNILEKSDILFLDIYTNTASPYFTHEVIYGETKPSELGEFSINYSSGEVYVYGDRGRGIESPVLATYKYRRTLIEDFDYYIYEDDITFNKNRLLLNNYGYITFSYEKVFKEGIHYISKLHKEVMPEVVGSNLTSSFSLRVKNDPITDVFRVVNKTTQEIYRVISFSGNEIFFSGSKSPNISNSVESASFKRSSRERIFASESFISTSKSVTALSVSQVEVVVGNKLPQAIIDSNTTYYLTANSTSYKVKSFTFSNGLVVSIETHDNLPTSETHFTLGTRIIVFSLKNEMVLDNKQNLGSFLSSSVKLTSLLFKVSKPLRSQNTTKDMLSQSGTVDYNYLLRQGNYIIDHIYGDIYLSEDNLSQDFGHVNYAYSEIDTSFGNHASLNIVRDLTGKELFYYKKTSDGFLLNDLDTNFDFFDVSDYSLMPESDYPLELKSDYTVPLFRRSSSVSGIFNMDDLFGIGATNAGSAYIPEKDDILNHSLLSSVNIVGNNVDFKVTTIRSFVTSGSFYEFQITEPDYGSFYSLSGDGVDIGSDLIFIKSRLDFRNYTQDQTSTTIYLYNSSVLSSLNTTHDKVFIDGILYNISASSITNKSITFDYTGAISDMSLAQSAVIASGLLSIHESSGITLASQFNFTYVPTNTPAIGSTFGVLYSSGNITLDYNYLKDNIHVYYEYGDNSIDWITTDFPTGSEYYVSYEYGALREALKLNFGILTDLSYFSKFGLSTDREVYRDALEASLKAFKEGPTKSALSDIGESLSKTKPDISESLFNGWILGRDYLSDSPVESLGSLIWGPVRYSSGLLFDKNKVSSRSANKLSMSEGTISFWMRNQWDKIENDSNLKVNIKQFSKFSYYHPRDNNIFNISGTNTNTGVEINKSILIQKSGSGVYFDIDSISPKDKSTFSFSFSVIAKGVITKDVSLLDLSFGDGYKDFKLSFSFNEISPITYRSISSEFIADHSIARYYRTTTVTGTEKAVLINEKVTTVKLMTSSNFSKTAFVLSSDGYLFEIIQQENYDLVFRSTPINWDGYRLNASINDIDLSNLCFVELEYTLGTTRSDSSGVFQFERVFDSEVEVCIDRNANLVTVGRNQFFYSDLIDGASERFQIISSSDSYFKLDRFNFSNDPYFDESYIFLGLNKDNPRNAKFNIDKESVISGPPVVSDPGVYLFTQTNDDFNLDSRSNEYWVCQVVSSETMMVPYSVISGETQDVEINHSFDSSIVVQAESSLYLVERSGSVKFEEKGYVLDSTDIVSVDNISLDIDNVELLDVNTQRYPVVITDKVYYSGSAYSSSDSSIYSHKFSYNIPELRGYSALDFSISITSVDTTYSNSYYSDILVNSISTKILTPIFEISSSGLYVKVLLGVTDFILLDEDNTLIGTVAHNSAYSFTVVYNESTGYAVVNGVSVPLDSTVRASFMSFLINDVTLLAAGHESFYPSTELSLLSLSLDVRFKETQLYDEDFSFSSYNDTLTADFHLNVDQYGLGYAGDREENKVYFISERPKYFFDTDNESISLYRDFDGFLKFKIKNDGYENVLSTEFTHLDRDSINHIAVSWISDDVSGSRMHIFINGSEAANLIRFGQDNEILGSVGSEQVEVLQDSLGTSIGYYSAITVDTVDSLNQVNFGANSASQGDIFVVESSLYLAGYAFIIKSISGGQADVLDVESMLPVSFNASDTITIRKCPSIQITSDMVTAKLGLFVNSQEVGVRIINSNDSTLVSSDPSTLVFGILDQSYNSVSFCRKGANGFYIDIERPDVIGVKTFGLFVENISKVLSFSRSSSKDYHYGDAYEIVSSFKTNLPRPISNDRVNIKKIILKMSTPLLYPTTPALAGGFISTGTFSINEKSSTSLDRPMEIFLGSDNVADGDNITLTVLGTSGGVSDSEIIVALKNTTVAMVNSYSEIESISFSCPVTYEDYEPLFLEVKEVNNVTDDVFVFSYKNGEFLISSESSYYDPVTLTKGSYNFQFKTNLNISRGRQPEMLFLGSNSYGKYQCASYLEEFKVTEVISEQVRPNAFTSDVYFDISKEYLSPTPMCPDINTLTLIDLNDPYDKQLRKLKTKIFYDERSKSKYKFEGQQLNDLSQLMNNKSLFVSKMQQYGFTFDESNQTFAEVHFSDSSPISDISRYYPSRDKFTYKRYNGPTSDFKGSGVIKDKLEVLNQESLFGESAFSLSMWFSPTFDTVNNGEEITLLEISNVRKETVSSVGFNEIVVSNEISKVLSLSVSSHDVPSANNDNILFDNISGLIIGASGSDKKYKVLKIKRDHKTIITSDMLPSKNTDVDVYFLKKNSTREELRLYIDESSQICLDIFSGESRIETRVFVDISARSWNKVVVSYSGSTLLFILNGREIGRVTDFNGFNRSSTSVYIGSRFDGTQKSNTRMSNVKISRRPYVMSMGIDGMFVDDAFVGQTPSYKDEYTSFMFDFDKDKIREENYIQVFDPDRGVFSFEVTIYDNFKFILDNNLEELLEQLINKAKPAHTKSIIRYTNTRC